MKPVWVMTDRLPGMFLHFIRADHVGKTPLPHVILYCGVAFCMNGRSPAMRKMRKNHHSHRRYATILEAFLAFLVLLLIFFGIIQLYLLSLANMVSEYAAFRGARSSAVGFIDDLALREARVKTIPVSGAMIAPERSTDIGDIALQYVKERVHIEHYMSGERWLEYEYWGGGQVRHNSYKCPYYGQEIDRGTYCSVCKAQGSDASHLTLTQSPAGETTKFKLNFINYPLNMPLYREFMGTGGVNIRKTVELTNHAAVYLEE